MAGNVVSATVKMVEGLQLVGYAGSGHAVVIDADSEAGGLNTGSKPMELVLIALGACTSMDVISILRKKREDLQGLEVKLSGVRAADDPMVYTRVRFHYVLKGKELSPQSCKASIELSQEKYCSVLGMVSKTANIEYDWEIVEQEIRS